MATELAKAYVQIIPSAQGIQGGITKVLGGDAAASAAGESFGSKLVGTIKGAIATAGIGAALTKTVTEGANLEQSIGGIKTMFKDSFATVKAYADEAYASAGLSANAYMESVTGFSARLLQGLGGDTEAAARLAHTAMTDMADNANKMGTDMSSIQETYQSLARGNYEMLDNLKLGYGGTQAEMARLINDSGVLGDTMVATADNVNSIGFDKMIQAIHTVQEEMGITGTTALEAATTLTGSFNAMKASFQNVQGNLTLGQDVAPALNALAQTVTTFLVGNLLPAVWNILSALPGALVTFVQALAPQMVTALMNFVPQLTAGMTTSLPQLIQSGISAVGGIINGINTALPQLLANGTAMITNLVSGVTLALPQLIQSGLTVVTSFLQMINSNLPQLLTAGVQILTSLVTGVQNTIPQIVTAAMTVMTNFLQMIISNLPQTIAAGAQVLSSVVQGILNSMPQIISSAAQMISTLLTTIVQHLPQIISAGFDLIVSLVQGIGNAMPNIISAAGEAALTILDTFLSIDWAGLGRDIISGLINGIMSMGGALWDAATEMARSAFDAIADFFEIASPSKLMRDKIGKFIPAGLAQGILDNAGLVDRAMLSLSDGAQDALPKRISAALQSGSQIQPAVARNSTSAAVIAALQTATAQIVTAVQQSGGDLYIGDDVIGRSYDRYSEQQAILLGR